MVFGGYCSRGAHFYPSAHLHLDNTGTEQKIHQENRLRWVDKAKVLKIDPYFFSITLIALSLSADSRD